MYSVEVSQYLTVISKILMPAYFNLLDITAECLDITFKYIRWMYHS